MLKQSHTQYVLTSCVSICCAGTFMAQLNKEKVDLENRLEAEQEYVVNKLCKQVGSEKTLQHAPALSALGHISPAAAAAAASHRCVRLHLGHSPVICATL